MDQSPHAAMMIDFDNVTMGIRSNLGQELRKLLDSDIIRGKVSVQRAYADWRRYPQYIVPLSEASIDLIFAPAYGSSKKNATDIRLAIDALEIVFTRPEIGTFILLSGDSDFSSLVLKLKEYGKYIIGVGMQESSSDLLVQNCDEYYSYNSLSGLTAANEVTTETFDPWVLAARTIDRMIERKDVMRSDRFKQVMLEFDPSFSERALGFSKFNRFLSEAASRGIIVLEKAANGQYEVSRGSQTDEFAKGTVAAPEKSPRAPSRRGGGSGRSGAGRSGRSSSGGRSRSGRGGGSSRNPAPQGTREAPPSDQPTPEVDEDRLRAAYDLLKRVVAELSEGGEPVRDSEVKRQMLKHDGRFDEAALGFRKFSRFLRQAHDEEVINLDQGPEGNYLVSSSEGDVEGDKEERASRNESRREKPSTPAPRPEASREESPEVHPDVQATHEAREHQAREHEARQKESRNGRGRRGRGRDRDRGSARESTPAAERPADQVEPPVSPSQSSPESPSTPQSTPQSKSTPRSDNDEAAGEASAASAAPEKPARTLSRFRRGSRGRSAPSTEKADSSQKIVPGPVETPSLDGGPQSGSASRGGSGAERQSIADRRASHSQSPSDASEVAEKYRSEIESMSRNYPGVGKRTAERLYEEFGEDLLDVIDSRPERITALLPEHRARAVIAGREAERDSSNG